MATKRDDWTVRLALGLGLVIALLGMANNLPNIPGLLEAVQAIPGLSWLQRISKYDTEYFFPLMFVLMMTVVLLQSSFARDWNQQPALTRGFGYFLDAMMLLAIASIAIVYLIENEQVCLIDVLSGERARLMAENLARAKEYMEIFGTAPVEDYSDCQARIGAWIVPFLVFVVGVFFIYIVKLWGFPIVAVAIAFAIYTLLSSAAWYFDWTDNKYLTTAIGTEVDNVRNSRLAVIAARNAIIQDSNGLLGQFLNILVNTVFPYVVLGALFGASAGGRSLIKMAINLTSRMRGGPAHAAVVGSAMFGTVSGGPVVNVLGTGTLTIPMMIKNGFRPTFAGGVEAAASSGGQIMPPVMGVAAFVLAALSTVPYSDVIVAAFLPAIVYFFCLFLTIVFESRRMKIEPLREAGELQRLTREDWKNVLMIVGPIATILVLLLSTKDDVATGTLAYLTGHDPASGADLPWLLALFQNSAGDPDSAGFWAVIVLLVLLFLDPEVRKQPHRVLHALAVAGITIAELFLLLVAIAVIDICISFTNVTGEFTIDILGWVQSASTFTLFGSEFVIGGATYLMLALVVAMFATVVLGMGMPTLPAYVNVILVIGPLLAALGTSSFTAHMFVFYFAAASAITPPVAIAAFAASTISKSDPLATGFAAVRAGIVMFVVPFIFAFYPELLLIEQAQIAQSLDGSLTAEKAYLPGYDGTISLTGLSWLMFKLTVALYLVASALAAYDKTRLSVFEIVFRLSLGVLIMFKIATVANAALAVAGLYLTFHHFGARPLSGVSGVFSSRKQSAGDEAA